MNFKCSTLKVTGKVQMVGFRYNTYLQAIKRNLFGYAKNLPDGGVEVQVFGNAEKVDELIHWLGQGPKLSHVAHVELLDSKVDPQDHATDFKIL